MRIRWKTWTPAHLHSAQNAGRPILLSIGATWCHWCHTMERVTYKDERTQKLISEHFTPLRVDTDERPDINGRYNVGGWPSTVVLNLCGKVIGGATYLEPEQLTEFLTQSLTLFHKSPHEKPAGVQAPKAGKDIPDLSHFCHDAFTSYYDEVNGGFGIEPKFPHYDLLLYLIDHRAPFAERMLTHTLYAMQTSELHDAAGGFYRYAAHANWTYPHFEKLLLDNAHLLEIYTLAHTRDKSFTHTAKRIYHFINTLWTGHAYANSQDADAAYESATPDEYIDKRTFTEPNAQTAIALLAYARAFKSAEARERAHTILDHLVRRITNKGAHRSQSKTSPNTLRDTTTLLKALRASNTHHDAAARLERALITNYYDEVNGGFYDLPQPPQGFGLLAHPYKDFNENMHTLLALHPSSADVAAKTLRLWSVDAKRHGAYTGLYELARKTWQLSKRDHA